MKCRFDLGVLLAGVRHTAAWMLFVAAGAMLAGCGAVATNPPQLGVVSVTNPATSAALSSVIVSVPANVSVAVSRNEENLGVDWAVTCTGSPVVPAPANPCGTIAPAHVAAGQSTTYTAPLYVPIGNSVTLVASVTSDPSVTSGITLPVIALPITIQMVTPPPATLGVNTKANLVAVTSNDTTPDGMSWTLTCATGGASCGSLQSSTPVAGQYPALTSNTYPTMTYTAPATIPGGGVMTITVTSVADPAKTVSSQILISPISVTVTPAAATVVPGASQPFMATVLYDSTGAGVNWSASCNAPPCGTVSPTKTTGNTGTATYTAPATIPSGTTVTITAASVANGSVTGVATLMVQTLPIAVTVTPAAATVQPGGSLSLVAAVANDPKALGVNWTLSCGSSTAGACGSITGTSGSGAQVLYIAPGSMPPNPVTLTATSIDGSVTSTATITLVPKIAVAFTPPLPTPITAGAPVSFTATVTNDAGSAGVDWTATCTTAPCGTFSPSHTASGVATSYTAPLTMAAGTVTIIAASTASNTVPPVVKATSTVTVTPVIVTSFVPYAPSQMLVSNQITPVKLTAVVANDATNAGVIWSVCANVTACGQFLVSPALAATATTPPVNAVYASILTVPSGQVVAYLPPATVPQPSGTVTITVQSANPQATAAAATATATIAIVDPPLSIAVGVPLHGVVQAGPMPVAGAAVSLYAAGTTGYSSLASQLLIASGDAPNQVTTNANGQFTIPGGYTCPSQSSQMYLVAVNGNPGPGINPNLSMMTALGPCSGLSSNVNLVVNEVTTVASVWALVPFMSSYGYVGSSSTNATTGLANAFATVNNLVNVQTGQALATTPVGNAIAPAAKINALADILNTCTGTEGGAVGDGSPCAALFGALNPTLTIPSMAPRDTIQAALNIAQNPILFQVFNLLPAKNRPFATTLTTTPNDWTLSLAFSGGGLGVRAQSTALAIDTMGDVWVTNSSRGNSLSELNNLGAPLSPAATNPTGTTPAVLGGFQGAGLNNPNVIAIDPLGNVWVGNNGGMTGTLSEFSSTGVALSPAGGFPAVSGSGGLQSKVTGIAIDGTGNVWATSTTGAFGAGGVLSWFAGANAMVNGAAVAPGTALSPPAGYGAAQGVDYPSGGIAVDTAGTVWVLNFNNYGAAELNSVNGAFIQTDYGWMPSLGPLAPTSGLVAASGSSLVIDSSGNAWFTATNTVGNLEELVAGGSILTYGGLGSLYSIGNSIGFAGVPAGALAIDGAGHLWEESPNATVQPPSTSSPILEVNSSGTILNQAEPYVGFQDTASGGQGIAIDGSGNLWVLHSGASPLSEFIGVATPVVTPLSLGVQNRTLAKKP